MEITHYIKIVAFFFSF